MFRSHNPSTAISVDPIAFVYFIEMVESSTHGGSAVTRDDLRHMFAHACAGAVLTRLAAKHRIPEGTLVEHVDFDENGRVLVELTENCGEVVERIVSESTTELYSAVEVAFDR